MTLPRCPRVSLLLVAGFASAIFAAAAPAVAQVAPSETLVPATTQYWVSIPNVDDTVKAWNKTELGQLAAAGIGRHIPGNGQHRWRHV